MVRCPGCGVELSLALTSVVVCGVWANHYNRCLEPRGHAGCHSDGEGLGWPRSELDTDVRPQVPAPRSVLNNDGFSLALSVGTTLADAELALIRATLDRVGGDRRMCAQLLGTSLRTLYRKLPAKESPCPDSP